MVLSWHKGSPKAVLHEVSLDGPSHEGVSYDMGKGDQIMTPGKIHNVCDRYIEGDQTLTLARLRKRISLQSITWTVI
jgi:hypothetical protein